MPLGYRKTGLDDVSIFIAMAECNIAPNGIHVGVDDVKKPAVLSRWAYIDQARRPCVPTPLAVFVFVTALHPVSDTVKCILIWNI